MNSRELHDRTAAPVGLIDDLVHVLGSIELYRSQWSVLPNHPTMWASIITGLSLNGEVLDNWLEADRMALEPTYVLACRRNEQLLEKALMALGKLHEATGGQDD